MPARSIVAEQLSDFSGVWPPPISPRSPIVAFDDVKNFSPSVWTIFVEPLMSLTQEVLFPSGVDA